MKEPTDLTDITIKTWPNGQKSVALAALRFCLGDDPVLRLSHPPPPPPPPLLQLAADGSTPADPASPAAVSGIRLSPGQVPGQRYLVEYAPFAHTAVARFEQALTQGAVPDDAVGFARFASTDFSQYTAFLNHWVRSDFVQDQIVINLGDLYDNPVVWLHRMLGMLNPDQPPTPDQLDRISQAAPGWIAAHPLPDLTSFRHYTPALFEQLGKITLRRDVVQRVFHEVMGRDLEDTSIVHFQTLPDTETLILRLMESREYVLRESETMTALGSYDRVTPEVLSSPAYKRWEFSHKTKLGWPLNQVFISRKAGLIYCPIGKVACTFLKRQMVHVSDVAHLALIVQDVHGITDTIRTGLQLSDYPIAQAEAFIADPGIFKFAVLRPPRERLLSAYIEKFVLNRTEPGNIYHIRSVLGPVQQRKGLAGLDADAGISFRDFICEITSQPSPQLDPHWRPQADYLQGITYDRLFRFDQMDAVMDLLENRSGQKLSRQPQNVTGSGSGRADIAAADLLPAQIMALPKLDKSCFFDAPLEAAIASYFSADEALLRQTYDDAILHFQRTESRAALHSQPLAKPENQGREAQTAESRVENSENAANALSPQDIKTGYLLLLGRHPSSEEIQQMQKRVTDLRSLREMIVGSAEFTEKYPKKFRPNQAKSVTQSEPEKKGDGRVSAPATLLPRDSERIVFLHIPKCGGTTLHSVLKLWYGKNQMHAERFNELYYQDIMGLGSRRVFSGHFDFYSTSFIPGPKTFISVLRDPMDRLISLYNFNRAHGSKIIEQKNLQHGRWANEYDIDSYFAHPIIRSHHLINNSMMRHFSNIPQIDNSLLPPSMQSVGLDEMLDQAIENLSKFAFIGFMDQYESDVVRLARVLSMTAPRELHKEQVLDNIMDTNLAMKRIEKQRPSPASLEAMEELIAYDRIFYARARARFAS